MVKTKLVVLTLAACGMCHAGTLLYVTGTGTFSGTDTADTFVTPGDSFRRPYQPSYKW